MFFLRLFSIVYLVCVSSVVGALTKEEADIFCDQAKLCQQSYSLAHDPKASSDKNIYPFGSGEKIAEGFIKVAEDKKSITVVFKGTSTAKDVITDLKALWAIDHTTEQRCHNGALNRFQELLPNLEELMSRVIRENNVASDVEVHLTGHSLGGALLPLAALHFERKKLNLKTVSLIAPFKVLDSVSAAEYDKALKERTYTIIHANDLVPMMGGVSWSDLVSLCYGVYQQFKTPNLLSGITALLGQWKHFSSGGRHVGQVIMLPEQADPHQIDTFVVSFSDPKQYTQETLPFDQQPISTKEWIEHHGHKAFVYLLVKLGLHPSIQQIQQAQSRESPLCTAAAA